jgi:hypothetical protein
VLGAGCGTNSIITILARVEVMPRRGHQALRLSVNFSSLNCLAGPRPDRQSSGREFIPTVHTISTLAPPGTAFEPRRELQVLHRGSNFQVIQERLTFGLGSVVPMDIRVRRDFDLVIEAQHVFRRLGVCNHVDPGRKSEGLNHPQ